MWLKESSPLGAFSRILLASSHWTNSAEYCYVWGRLDTQFGCSAFQLMRLGQSISEEECSLWRTPTRDVSDRMMNGEEQLKAGYTLNLSDQVRTLSFHPRLWRSPDSNVRGGAQNGQDRVAAGHQLNLQDQVVNPKLWPTPRASDYKGSGPEGSASHEHMLERKYLCATMADSSSGSLNPRFVEQLQGFPIDHTALKHWETWSFRSRPTHSLKP